MSLFWEKQSSNRKFNIKNFRNTKNHNIFANWSPYSRGLTFYNFFINYYVNNNKENFIKFKKKINNLNLGDPPGIIYNNKYKISYDDCISFEEFIFLKKNFYKKNIKNIIEVGPGYGRMVEVIIKNFNVTKYIVIDYKNILILTKKYLSKVLNKIEFNKIEFLNFEDFQFKKDIFKSKFKIDKFDLFLNSDSFHEIEKNIIKKYQRYFSPICSNFFVKNAFGKYNPKDLINHLNKSKIPKKIKNLGLCCDKINVFDNNKKVFLIRQYLKRYNPYKKANKVYHKLSEVYPTTVLAIFSK